MKMKKRSRSIFENIRKERRKEQQFTATMIFLAGIMGAVIGRCSCPNQNIVDFKRGVVAPDSGKKFQPGDTIKVILINEKQR